MLEILQHCNEECTYCHVAEYMHVPTNVDKSNILHTIHLSGEPGISKSCCRCKYFL